MEIEKVIQKLGYKRKEAQVYLATLLLGESRVADIAAKVKIARSSVNVIIEKLHREGLINFYWKRCQKFWMAENPEKLLRKLQQEEATLQAILPELQALRQNAMIDKPTARVYAGVSEMKHIFEDILSTRNNFCGFIAWCDLVEVFGEEYVRDFIHRQNECFLKVRLLVPEGDATRELKERDRAEGRETRFLNNQVALNTANIMYGNKVAIISLTSGFPTAFLIEDQNINSTMSQFFEKLWHSA